MGLKDGQGKYTYADGSVYDGEWWMNKINGYGSQTWADGKCYYGQWSENDMNGYGMY